MPQRLTTRRLTLRRPSYDDVEAIFAFASDPIVTRYMTWPTHRGLDESYDFVEAVVEGWQAGDECGWLVEQGDRVIGSAACHFGDHGAELGYVLARAAWGAGLATEAAAAIFDAVSGLDEIHRVFATCDPDNRASQRVLEKIGMAREGRLRRYSARPNLAGGDDRPGDVLMYAWVRS